MLSGALAVLSIFFAYLYSLPSPSEEQILNECDAEIASGNYTQYENPLANCIEDYWKAVGASDGLWILSLILFVIASGFALIGRKLNT